MKMLWSKSKVADCKRTVGVVANEALRRAQCSVAQGTAERKTVQSLYIDCMLLDRLLTGISKAGICFIIEPSIIS